MKATDIIDFLQAHRPKVYWECDRKTFAKLAHILDDNHQPLYEVESRTLAGVPVLNVLSESEYKGLRLSVRDLPGSGITHYEFRPPCDCKEFKLTHQTVKYRAPWALICAECGRESDKFDVVPRL